MAKNRFYTPANRKTEPSAAAYSPQNNLGDLGIIQRNHKTAFGKQTIDVLDTKYHKREQDQIPGPGTY